MQNGSSASEDRKTIRFYKPTSRRVLDRKWPGSDLPLKLLYLSCEEQQACYFAARRYFEHKGQAIDELSHAQFQLEMEYQQMAVMLLQPDTDNPQAKLFDTVDALRREMTPNEATFIVEQHIEEQEAEAAEWSGREVSPFLRQLARVLGVDEHTDPEQLIALVASMKDRLDG